MHFSFGRIKNVKLLIPLLLFVMVVFVYHILGTFSTVVEDNAYNGIPATSFAGGNGTEINPYIISTPNEMDYFRLLITGEEAEYYSDKCYMITSSLNFGDYDITIDNEIPFKGSLDGDGHQISNLKINNSFFKNLDGATIKNIELTDIQYLTTSNEHGVFVDNSVNSTYNLINLDFEFNNNHDYLATFIYNDTGSTINNVVINVNNVKNDTYYGLIYKANQTTINSALTNNAYNDIAEDNTIVRNIYHYTFTGGRIFSTDIDKFESEGFKIEYSYSKYVMKDIIPSLGNERIGAYQEHDTGTSGNTIYINNLTKDLDYYTSLNYASSTNRQLPTMDNKNIYNENNLVKVMLSYSGVETNGGTTLTGTISSTENYNKIVYYDYIPVENNKIKITLIDNPFVNRPNNKGFNNWISDTNGVVLSYDTVRYERFAELNVTKNAENKYDPIEINLHASWVEAVNYGLSGNNWTNAFNSFDTKGLKQFETTREECTRPSVQGYYLEQTAPRYTYYTGYYRSSGSGNNATYTYATDRYCNTRGGCTYYEEIEYDELYDPDETYYTFSGNRRYVATPEEIGVTCEDVHTVSDTFSPAGYYTEKTFGRGASYTGYYNSSGQPVSGTCNSTSCTYYEFIQSFDAYGNRPVIDFTKNYYYLVTRDTNIAYLTGDITNYWSSSNASNKPFTLTGLHNGYQTSYDWTVTGNHIKLYNDTAIEQLTIYNTKSLSTDDVVVSSGGWWATYYAVIDVNYHNLKVGRGVKQYNSNYATFDYIFGGEEGTGSSSSDTKYNVIVESGHYSSIALTLLVGGSGTAYVANKTTLGCDVDKVLDTNNNNLEVYYQVASSFSGTINSSEECATNLTVKSGKFGTSQSDMYTGIYVGGLTSGTHNAARRINVEGGWINNLIGGPLTASNRRLYNDTYIYMTGGTVDIIIGGAGRSPTYGNRIISVTGGKVNYSVLGGSNGSGSDASGTDGTINGSSYIYIGGHATIGDTTLVNNNSTLWGVASGSVFGNGNGKSGYSGIGSNENSYVIIDGKADIKGSVFGGGNFGATGVNSASDTNETKINILGGTVSGDVYGGGNQNGAGSTDKRVDITITQTGGTVKGSVYGGSNISGTIYGNTSVNITKGSITKNVYGGGKGNSTYVRNNSSVVIGNTTTPNVPTISGSVYGGSGYGTVNGVNTTTATSNAATTVTVNNGKITGSVFGGGEGSTTYTPYVLGNITVTINNGSIGNVFGGNDQAGSHTKTNRVYLKGGTLNNAYGGGNKSSVTTTNVYLQGSTLSNLFGGSNQQGDVTTSNVTISSGKVNNIYGGNNEGGTTTTTHITVEGTADITGSVFGGGNQAATVTSNVILNSAAHKITDVFGGGNAANVTTTNITNKMSVDNMFGGSNSAGTVQNSYIINNGGTHINIYGGNNRGGNTVDSSITFNSGTATAIFGGGNLASTGTTLINLEGGTVTTVYGGGNSAGATSSTINNNAGTITTIYGGSNVTGDVGTTNINNDNSVGTIFGGGNSANVGTTNIDVTSGNITTIYGGGNLAKVTGNTTLSITNANVSSNIYGGGNFGVVNGSSNLTVIDTTVLGSIYGGGNGGPATLQGSTEVNIGGNTVVGTETSVAPHFGSVFAGGNSAETGLEANNNSVAKLNIAGGTIYGNIYGGANTSVIYGNTIVNVGKSVDKDIKKGDIFIKGHVFGGGEANAAGDETYDWYFISVTQGVVITIDADTYDNFTINGSFYGGGNASSASGDSYLYIKNYGAGESPKRNVSIQRVTYVDIDNSSLLLLGAIDRANDYDKELFSISRVVNMTIRNNSELYLATGANLLENFNSLDSSGNPAVVTITEDSITKSVDNRVYMFEGKNLNIARDQQVTDYGKVTGMSFFGMFNYNYDGTVHTGNYGHQYNDGDELSWQGTFTRGSYVLGLHETNHDITVNGFYSNFMDEETMINDVKYIEPTPPDSRYYMWFIGENVIEYNVNLTASKYSTLGSVEVSFLEFYDPNTSFEILNFDSSEIAEGVTLVNKENIPRIASDPNVANNQFGLSLEASNTGWLTKGKTNFYTANPNMTGVTYYEGENSTNVPTMLFYLYHSKNITEEKELGTVRISVMAITKESAISNKVRRLVINVKMNTALFQTVEYEGAMTPGDKYELFTSTSNNITNKSKLSAYYALYGDNQNLYKAGYHRVLTSTFALPVNTKITMIDFVNNTNNYYYYTISETDYNASVQEFNTQNESSYPLSRFMKMGTDGTTSYYDDAAMNALYYDGRDSTEEFIFIVDFSGTDLNTDKIGNKLLIEMRNSDNESVFTVLGIEHNQLTYNLYNNKESKLDINVTPSDNPLYVGYNDIFDVSVDYFNSSLEGQAIIDTQYFDDKMGVEISLIGIDGNTMSGTDLVGTYFEIDNKKYYPDIGGVTHIKLSDKVGNVKKWIIFNTDNTSLATGDYTFKFEVFGSEDGIYYSHGVPDTENVDILLINSVYGFNPVIDENSSILSTNNDKSLKFSIDYTSTLLNPNIRVSLYRRGYNEIYDTGYQQVDLQDYVDQVLFPTNNEKEYLLISGPSPTNNFNIAMKQQLLSGTYRVVFSLYDNDTKIGEIIRYIIIKEDLS